MVDVSQIIEARAHRADAVLLIVAALSDAEMRALLDTARGQELDVLVEVHDERELERALTAGSDIIGVNNRDLRTFEVKLDTALGLARQIPSNVLRVAESGIHCGDDIARLRDAGYDAFLIGESLMKAARPGEALRALMAPGKAAAVREHSSNLEF
jgi:indole-3-glycerol phosphate synthase